MTVTIGLIRHGSTFWNKEGRAQGHTNNPLDEEGLAQAVALAERLSGEKWDYLYSSDLLRAQQTAEAISQRLGIGISGLIPGMREMNGGLIEGTNEQDRVERWGKDWKSLDLGLESPESASARGGQSVRELAERHPGKNILVVSHGALLRHTLKGLVPSLDVQELLKNTSLTRITTVNGTDWSCELYNCAEHLNG